MPVYEYAGLDSSGKTLKGILDADSTVAACLLSKGFW